MDKHKLLLFPKCYHNKTMIVVSVAAESTALEIALDFYLFLKTFSIITKYKHKQRSFPV